MRKKVRRSGVRIDAPWKPKLYWEQQGYSPSKIARCPSRDDARYGTLYQIEVTTEVDKRYEEEAEAELLEREAEATRKRKAKNSGPNDAGEPEWNVPDAVSAAPREAKAAKKEPAEPSAKAEERAKAKAARDAEKQEKANAGVAAFAGKSLSLLHPKLEDLKAVRKLLDGKAALADITRDVDEATLKIMSWIQHSRAVVAAHAASPKGRLDPLPYDAVSLKATVQASGELARWARVKNKEMKQAEAPKAKAKAASKKRCTAKKPDGPAEAVETQPYPDP